MGHLFLDIETYQSKDNPDSSLCPYHPESKIIIISYTYYPTFKPPQREEINQPVFLKEWESSEYNILKNFYESLCEIQVKDKFVKFCGFNITKFDLPYLFGRMKVNKIADEIKLHNVLFRPFAMDLFYLSSIISDQTIQKEQLWGMNHKEVSSFFNLQVKEGTGDECSRFYDKKDYDKIVKYCIEEFNFEQMLDAFYLYILKNVKNQKEKSDKKDNREKYWFEKI